MAQLTYREAIARGIAQEMRRDESVVFLGEDIGAAGVTQQLSDVALELSNQACRGEQCGGAKMRQVAIMAALASPLG